MYLRIRTNRRLDTLTKRQKQNPLPGDDASTANRAERDEQVEASRPNITPSDGPHLELARLRLKTWSKYGFLVAEAI